MKGKNSPEKILTEVSKLEVTEFLGVCKILGVSVYKDDGKTPKEFENIWEEMCDVVWGMNRVRRRNLGRLIYSTTKGKED